jgi:hypothetical protein
MYRGNSHSAVSRVIKVQELPVGDWLCLAIRPSERIVCWGMPVSQSCAYFAKPFPHFPISEELGMEGYGVVSG